ncbi:class E sortase [Streptomyces sp. NPDC020965]|uniref:class E sortase n=1 Tax=Streptomyces sp. NPDC020965 TaxID=3365105 RepID=UPI0037B7091D
MAVPRALTSALTTVLGALFVGCLALLVGCADAVGDPTAARGTMSGERAPSDLSAPSTPERPLPVASAPAPTPVPPKDRTVPATLAIPALGLADLPVVPYEGTTDDTPGTVIQNRGVAASPYGADGGVGPGEIGNYLVTAHRLSAGGPLRDLPSLRKGDTVVVTAGGRVHTYEITETRSTSFRSGRSLAEQRAPVPGQPGERPTRAMITISTCATPEDDAAGNFWRDDRGNPEHRIDKIGVLRGAPSPAPSP